jgi:hypothetical protein
LVAVVIKEIISETASFSVIPGAIVRLECGKVFENGRG